MTFNIYPMIIFIILTSVFNLCVGEYVTSPVRPLYECEGAHDSVPIYNWYASCKKACSPYSGIFNLSVRLYKDPRESITVSVYQINCLTTQVSSHTDIFNNCNYIHSSTVKRISSSDIDDLKKRIAKSEESNPRNSTLIIEDPVTPECSYFSDKYASYDSIIVRKTPGKMMYNDDRRGEIFVPSLSSYIKASETWSRWGETVVFWSFKKDVPSGCPLLYLGTHECINRTETGVIECPDAGTVFQIKERGVTICNMFNLYYSGYGYYIDVFSSFEADSQYISIKEGLNKVTDNNVAALVAQINNAYGIYTDSLCDSICDISERVFSIDNHLSYVIETPIGPWISWKSTIHDVHMVYRTSPCRRVSNWKMSSPLVFCNDTTGIFITDQSGQVELWDPSMTFFLPNRTCSDFSRSDIEERIRHNQTVIIHFWGKDMILESPYHQTPKWETNDLKIFRSTRWTPYLHGVDLNLSEEVHTFLDELDMRIKNIKEIHGRMRPFNFATTIASLATRLWSGVTEKISSVTNMLQITGMILGMISKIIPLCLLCILIYFSVKFTLFVLYGDTMKRDKRRREERNPEHLDRGGLLGIMSNN